MGILTENALNRNFMNIILCFLKSLSWVFRRNLKAIYTLMSLPRSILSYFLFKTYLYLSFVILLEFIAYYVYYVYLNITWIIFYYVADGIHKIIIFMYLRSMYVWFIIICNWKSLKKKPFIVIFYSCYKL